MSEEINVSGADTAVENSEMTAENSVEGTAEETKGTSAENENEDNISTNDGESETKSENGSVDNTETQESAPADEVFFENDDGVKIMRSQAEDYARLGYDFRQNIEPIMEKFARIAAASTKENGENFESLSEFAEFMLGAIDENLRERCLEDARGDEDLANELFNSRKAVRDSEYNEKQERRRRESEQAQSEKTQKIADEFLKLQKKFPEIKTYAELPQEVKTYAAKNGVSLLEAKLTIDYDNRISAEKAKADAENAANKTTGSQAGSSDSGTDDVIAAMLRGASRY